MWFVVILVIFGCFGVILVVFGFPDVVRICRFSGFCADLVVFGIYRLSGALPVVGGGLVLLFWIPLCVLGMYCFGCLFCVGDVIWFVLEHFGLVK